MCNKCEVTSLEPATHLLKIWANIKSAYEAPREAYRRAEFMRNEMRNNHRRENVEYWHHGSRSWVTSDRPNNQKRGHEIAMAHAINNKTATRDATTIEDMAQTHAYLKSLEYLNRRISMNIEPTYDQTAVKLRDGTWEALDIMEKLHPYLTKDNRNNDDYDAYHLSRMYFVQMNYLHKVHVSTEDINQIAYYPTLKHMRDGREVRTRLGRYLTKYQTALALTDADIKSIAEKHMANMRSRGGWEVDFIEHDDEAGWLRVYDSENVGSCMRGMDAIRVYAHEKSVLRLAHVKAGDRIVARCIVRDGNDDERGWLRVYPDANGSAEGRFLLDYLKTNGYEKQTNLDGVLLRYITEGSSIVCPYIDSGNNGDQSVGVVHRNGVTYLKAGGNDYTATETNGYVEDNTYECDDCGDRCDESDITYIESADHHVCECCRDNDYTYAFGRRHEEYFPNDEVVEVGGTYYWTQTIMYHDEVGYCQYNDEYYLSDDLVSTADGDVHVDDAVELDHEDSNGYSYAIPNKVHTLSDGTTCHEDEADHYQAEIDDALLEEAQA